MTEQARPDLTVDGQLCFALYAASRAMTGRYRPLLDELGLTYPQYLVMLVLWEHDRIPVGRLGERLRLETGTLSPLLKRLESRGMLDRRRRTNDERSIELVLTPQGRALRERAAAVQTCVAEATGLTLPSSPACATRCTDWPTGCGLRTSSNRDGAWSSRAVAVTPERQTSRRTSWRAERVVGAGTVDRLQPRDGARAGTPARTLSGLRRERPPPRTRRHRRHRVPSRHPRCA